MSIYEGILLLAGLSLFLYGMNVMGVGLEKATGGTLEKILKKFTKNIFTSLLLGLIVTAIIQSSSATTVLVIGFVNAGFLTLKQSIGIMMGANIGTTITAQIIRLSDMSSNNMFLKIFDIDNLVPVFLVIGIAIYMFCKSNKKKNIGQILLGFGLLFLGLTQMKTAVSPLKDSPFFYNMLEICANLPLLAFIGGAIMTAVIQSSSASVGILQALSSTGTMNFAVAYPIILGQNVGTCITAIISSFGTNKNAKRAAMVHLYFNIIGSALFFIGIWLLIKFGVIAHLMNSIVDSGVIANFHTVFNVVTTLVLLPFTGVLEKLANISVKDKKGKKEQTLILDERILVTPSLAISKCNQVIRDMANLSLDNYLNSISLFDIYNEKLVEKIQIKEDKIDEIQDTLEIYMSKIIDNELSDNDTRRVTYLFNIIGDFERISDYSINMLEQAQNMNQKGLKFSDEAKKDFDILTNAVKDIISITIESFKKNDIELADKIEPLEEVIDSLVNIIKINELKREKNIDNKLIFSEILMYLERISDHCSNIGIHTIANHKGVNVVNRHEYIRQLHNSKSDKYVKYMDKYTKKYLDLINA